MSGLPRSARINRTCSSGRDREAKKLLALLSSERVILFYSPSGAGKTSLINAKIVPALKKKQVTVLPVARVGGDLPPHLSPHNVYVFNALSYLARNIQKDSLPDHLLSFSIQDFIRFELDAGERKRPFVMIIDQFEEIITTHPGFEAHREEFFQQMRQAIASNRLLSVVFVMREDRIAGLDTYAPLLPDRLNTRFRMERLGRRSAVEAIRLPALEAGRPYAENVAEALADNLREERAPGEERNIRGQFVEPVQLQVVCLRLWESLRDRPGSTVTHQDLAAFGDVDQALETFYEDSIRRVARKSRLSERSIRLWFQKQLITETGIRRQVNRGETQTGWLPNAAVDKLENQHLVRSENARGGIWYELVHDRLIAPILKSNARWLKKVRNRRLFAAAVAVALAGVLGVSTWARYQARLARLDEAASLSQQALEVLESHPPRSLWLAREAAARATYTGELVAVPQAKDTLRRALQASQAKLVGVVPSGEVMWLGMDLGGQRLATLDPDGGLSVWDSESGRLLRALDRGDGPIEVAALSGDGARLATFARDGVLTLWSVDAGSELARFPVDAEPQDLLLSPDGRYLAATGYDGSVSLWHSGTGRKVFSLADPDDNVIDTVFRPGSERFATASDSGRIRVWLPEAEEPDLSLSAGEDAIVAFSSDGHTLVSVSGSGNALVWDYGAGGPPWLLDQPEPEQGRPGIAAARTQEISLDPDGRRLTLISAHGTVRAWDLDSNVASTILRGDEERLAVAVFSRDGRRLALANALGQTEVWELLFDEVPELFSGHARRVNAVAVSHDGRFVASASSDRTARLWESRSGREVRALRGHRDRVNDVAFRSDDKLLATASDDGTAKVWDRETGEVLHTLGGHAGPVTAVDFSPDGDSLATASLDGGVRVWDLAAGGERLAFSRDLAAHSLAFHPDGALLAIGGSDGLVRLWDTRTGRESRRLEEHQQSVIALAFSPDGTRLATASKDSTVKIWDLGSMQARTLAGHSGWVTGVTFAPDGRRLASCDVSKIILWGSDSGSRLWSIPSSGVLYDLAFSPDGERLATANKDASVRLEPLSDRELIRLAEERTDLEPRLASHHETAEKN